MRRFSLAVTLLALPVFAFSLMLAGCGSKDTGSPGGGSNSDVTQSSEKSTGPAKVLEPKGGVLKGKITLTSKPNVDQLSEKLKGEITKSGKGDFCLSGTPAEIAEQEYRIGSKNGNLGNVVVWVLPPANAVFNIDPKQLEEAKKTPVKIHQPHCAFLPHCAVAWVDYRDPKTSKKEKTGQYIEVVNDAKESHNTNYDAGPKNPGGNPTLSPGSSEKIQKLTSVNTPMTLKCNIHTWMKGYVWLLDTPYSAVSHSDTLDGDNKVKEDDDKFGTYEIKNLPVGKMRVIAWHEACGYLNAKKGQGDEIKIAEGKPTEKNFEATPK